MSPLPLSDEEITSVAAMQGRHAEERALLLGRQENERRELQRRQEDELLAARERFHPTPAAGQRLSDRLAQIPPAARLTPKGEAHGEGQ